ncbi:MAG: hypothetical protein QOI25_305, partial [Mycobacterium sp.]|nr:hypothetical protein [Mycobacterium sp.]
MEGVDEVGVKELPDGGRPAAKPDILALCGLPGPLEDCGRIIVDEVERG